MPAMPDVVFLACRTVPRALKPGWCGGGPSAGLSLPQGGLGAFCVGYPVGSRPDQEQIGAVEVDMGVSGAEVRPH